MFLHDNYFLSLRLESFNTQHTALNMAVNVLITVCTVVQNCCNGRSKNIGNGTFGGAPSQKPINGST